MTAQSEAAGKGAAMGWTRAFSLVAAGAISLALTLDPYLLSGVSSARVHAGLPLLMLGVCGAFAYGFGYRSETPVIRLLIHPAAAWALLGAGAVLIAMG